MKKMNFKSVSARILAVVIILSTLLIAVLGCTESKDGYATIVVGEETPKEYKVNLDKVDIKEGLMSVLEYLKKEQGLNYAATYSATGAYLTEVGGIKEDIENHVYLYIYTSVEKDFDVSEYATTKDYNGRILMNSGVGASSMTIEDGAVIYVGTIKF